MPKQDKQLQHHSHRQGFTLIETLVAITILVVAIGGPLVIASKGLSTALYARDQITAFYLAQEAIEFVRNERDSSGLEARSSGSSDFLSKFNACVDNPCTIDIRTSSVEVCDGECPALLYDESTGLYSHVLGSLSPFTRSVLLEEVNDNEATVTVTMNWMSGLLSRSFSIQEHLLEWFGDQDGGGGTTSMRTNVLPSAS